MANVNKRMYEKNLEKELRLRVSQRDFEFLEKTAAERSVSVSALVRYIVGEYRRSMELLDVMNEALRRSREGGKEIDVQTDINNQLQF